MDDSPSFSQAKASFVAFLESQGWPAGILWLTRDRITAHGNVCWIFRPEDLTREDPSRDFYEAVRLTNSSIRLDAIGTVGGRTVAYVQDWGGESKLLSFGVLESAMFLRVVSSSLSWTILRSLNRIRGESPFLHSVAMLKKLPAP